ncbi:MAG: DUF554 domain-containing protein [Chthonomonadaceae bacterium]|nr:DUF554 domain-containing protein [Chthonomonadaceae bacterium]
MGLPIRGTLLNTATVVVGSLLGWALGARVPSAAMEIALSALGLVTLGIGVKLFLESKNVLVLAFALTVGGVLGWALGIQAGVEGFAEWARVSLGPLATGRFSEAVVTTSILFCVGPMTLLGCLQEGLEGKIELLAIKSVLDGVGSVFFAATLGPGVLVTAAIVLVFQGALTLAAGRLRALARDPELLAEASAVGGAMLLAIGMGLLEIRRLPVANYLPALVLAPLGTVVARRWLPVHADPVDGV